MIGDWLLRTDNDRRLTKQLGRLARREQTARTGYVCLGFGENGTPFNEHRMIAGKILGRRLERDEHVHHVNGNKKDNRPCNLQVVPSAVHRKAHSEAKGYPILIDGYPRLGRGNYRKQPKQFRKHKVRGRRKRRAAKPKVVDNSVFSQPKPADPTWWKGPI